MNICQGKLFENAKIDFFKTVHNICGWQEINLQQQQQQNTELNKYIKMIIRLSL